MRQTTSRRGALGFLLAWAAGCTAKGPAYQPANIVPTSSTGVIYVYRPARTVATRGESPFVSINGKSYGAMKAGALPQTCWIDAATALDTGESFGV